eukprot:Em0022g243a
MDSETCSLSRKEHDAGAKSESLAGENNADGVSLCTQPSFTTSCSHDSSLDGGSSAVTESLNESDRGNLKNSTEELTQRSESTSSSDDSDSEAMLCRSRSISQSVSVLPSRGSSIDISKVPKTKESYLFKKGGRKNEGNWQKRWVTFNGQELKYFSYQGEKEINCKNSVALSEMIDVKKMSDAQYPNRFDLVVMNRVFQFYSENADESEAWVNVLQAAIGYYKPSGTMAKKGGNMANPDKCGFLSKQGHSISKGFKPRYVALKGSKFAYYETEADFDIGKPIHVLDMTLGNVRPDMVGSKCRFTITMNNQRSYVFQAYSEGERKSWMDALTSAILTGLDRRSPAASPDNISQTTLARIQENPANKVCADCESTEPVWGVINKGIMVCINCSGVHRSMGVHISKVRSVELDRHIWTDSLIKLMNAIGNGNSNTFWEKNFTGERLAANTEREVRQNFICSKYEHKLWIDMVLEKQEVLNKLLRVSVKGANLMRTVELLASGAKLIDESDDKPILEIAKAHNQELQVELLEQNGALTMPATAQETSPALMISKKGYLYKTGSDWAGWKRRYCTLDFIKGFRYYKTENDSEQQGDIKVEEMLSTSKFEEEQSKDLKDKDPKYKYCFEVITPSRGFLFCAETESEMQDWIRTFNAIIANDAADRLGFDKVGYLHKRNPPATLWKRRWFTLKDKELKHWEHDVVTSYDLRKVTELKSLGNEEFEIVFPDKALQLKAESQSGAEAWLNALNHTQVSGIPLSEQQVTAGNIPIIIHKCLQFVETDDTDGSFSGLDTEGLYRKSGEKQKIRKLIFEFNQDPRGVVIDQQSYTVHDVAGTLKYFFTSLPDPLLTHRLRSAFITAAKSENLEQMQTFIDELPVVNKETLARMMGHLNKVRDHEETNKMSVSNLAIVFGPTLMTVEKSPSEQLSFSGSQDESNCISFMISHYRELFPVAKEEQNKDLIIKKAEEKIKQEQSAFMQKVKISSTTDFLTTVYLLNKEGSTYSTKINAGRTVGDVLNETATNCGLPPMNYALYLVLGDSESHRVLSPSEILMAALVSAGKDSSFLCIKPNTFGEALSQYVDKGADRVTLHVKEKKKWKKYICTIHEGAFIQYRDAKGQVEQERVQPQEYDMFAGIPQGRIDLKNPIPTKYSFWLKMTRNDDNCKFLCADSEDVMLQVVAALVKAKYPDCFRTLIIPTNPLPPSRMDSVTKRMSTMPSVVDKESPDYANVKLSTTNSQSKFSNLH